jgi:hypothetical protein
MGRPRGVESGGRGDYVCVMTAPRFCCAVFCCAALLPLSAEAAAKPKTSPPAAAPPQAAAADPGPAHPLGSEGSWSAYMAQNKTGKICYIAASPEKTEPAGVKRQSVMATITHRTEDKVSNVVSFTEGYPLNESGGVTLEVGKDKFTLFAKDDSAWAATPDLDKAIVTALSKEKRAVLKAMPKKGHGTTDTYSLAGFDKALALIDKACDVKR